MSTFTQTQCLDEIKKYDWLILGKELHKDEVAKLVYEWVLTHKYFINEIIPFEVSFQMAVHSWYELVYQPLMQAMVDSCLINIYPKDMSLVMVIKEISDTYYTTNSGRSGDFVTYEEICRAKLFKMKGFLLTKIRSFLLR